MKTRLCGVLGIDIPIVLAPMGGAVGPHLTAAVSNAGGLGAIPLWESDIAKMRGLIRDTRARTARPFAGNLNLEFIGQEHLDACLEEGVSIISFFWGRSPKLVAQAKAAGAIVMQTVGSAAEARAAVGDGADVIVAQGWEAGGHVWSAVATIALVPAVVDAVGPVPVVAAGGIADGRGLAAVLALGASGAWIGTRFLASPESTIHQHYRDRVLQASETDTVYLENLFDIGWPDAPHRVLRNETVTMWEAAGRPEPGSRPGENEIVAVSKSAGNMTRYGSDTPPADAEGDIDALSMWAGQGAGVVRSIKPAAEIVREIDAEASAILKRLGYMPG